MYTCYAATSLSFIKQSVDAVSVSHFMLELVLSYVSIDLLTHDIDSGLTVLKVIAIILSSYYYYYYYYYCVVRMF